ncbi:hypothetical protein FKM82_009540 [Ascaphus truei]
MDYLSNTLRTSSELHLSRPCPVLQEAERWSREVKEFQSSSHDRFIICNPPLPKKSSSFALSDYPRETGTQDNMGLYRKPIHLEKETIWKTGISDESFRLGKKKALPPLWSELGVFPNIPRLLELDVCLTRNRARRSLQAR